MEFYGELNSLNFRLPYINSETDSEKKNSFNSLLRRTQQPLLT